MRIIRDFIHYVRNYRELRYYMDTRYICLQDVMHRTSPKLDRPGNIGRWCIRCCVGRFEQIDTQLWAFSSKRDAVMFKTCWGG